MKFNQNDPKYFLYLDLIGRELYGKSKQNSKWTDFRKIGIIVDETKNTVKLKENIATGCTIKQYIKDHFIFRCWLPQQEEDSYCVEFDGQKILGRPGQRIKKIRKKHWRKLH